MAASAVLTRFEWRDHQGVNMAANPLLPQNKTISFRGKPLQVQELIAAGLTGEVYRGVLSDDESGPTVAIKAMLPLALDKARELFMGEGETLARLMQAEEDRRDGLKVAPHYYGADEYRGELEAEGIPYLVMEFIDGQPIPDLLRKAKDGRWPEAQALTAIWQLFRTLDILHREIGKSYVDLKFENLWWVDKSDAGRLRMTDFGTLEEIKEGRTRGIRRDLLAAGAYAGKMLTGYMVDFSLSELRDVAEPHIKSASISFGAKQLLLKLLHRNEQVRPTTAKEVADHARNLVNLWQQSPERLQQIARLNLVKAKEDLQSPQARRFAEQARAALDILKHEDQSTEPEIDELIQQAEEILLRSDYLDRGRALFDGASFAAARQVFDEGRNWSSDPATLRRWAYLAQIGEDPNALYTNESRKMAARLVHLLSEKRWELARTELEAMRPELGKAKAFTYLQADIETHTNLAQADKLREIEDYAGVADAYKSALEAIKLLPLEERLAIQNEEVGNLHDEMQNYSEKAQDKANKGQSRHLREQAEKSFEAGNRDEAFEQARLALNHNPEDAATLEMLQDWAGKALNDRDYPFAEGVAVLALRSPKPGAAVGRIFVQAQALNRLQKALDPWAPTVFLTQLHHAAESLGSTSSLNIHLEPFVKQAAQQAASAYQAGTLRALADFAETKLHLREAVEWRVQADQMGQDPRRPAIDDALALAEERLNRALDGYRPVEAVTDLDDYLLYLDGREAVLRETQTLAEATLAEALTANYRRIEAESLVERARSALEQVNNDRAAAKQRQEEEQQVAATIHQLEQTTRRQEIMDLTGSLPQSAAELFILSTTYLTRFDSRDAVVTRYLTEASKHVDRLGRSGWQSVRNEAERHLTGYETTVEQARTAFESGAPVGEAILANLETHGDSPEVNELIAQLRKAKDWQKWLEDHQLALRARQHDDRLLRDLRREWLPFTLPPIYWQRSEAFSYLTQTADRLRSQLGGLGRQVTNPNYAEQLRKWVDLVMTRRLFQNEGAVVGTGTWDTETFTMKACREAMRGDIQALANLIETSPLPSDLDQALGELSPTAWKRALELSGSPEPIPPQSVARRQWPTAASVRAFVTNILSPTSPSGQATSRRQRLLRLGVGAAAAVLLLIVIAFLVVPQFGGPEMLAGLLQRPTATAESITAAPLPSPTSALPTIAPTAVVPPTLTPTPTLAPTATPSPTPTATPTAVAPQDSAFFVADPITLNPPPPIPAEALWRLPIEEAQTSPPLDDPAWLIHEVEGVGQFKYIENFPAPVSAQWMMDQPLAAGLYSLYVLDTIERSGGAPIFQVLLDGQPAAPFRGQSEVIFNLQSAGQTTNDWLWLGAYGITQGQQLAVTAQAQPTADAPFAAPAILVARLGTQERQLLSMLPDPSVERPVAALLDDDRVLMQNANKQDINDPAAFVNSQRWLTPTVTLPAAAGTLPAPIAWGGGYHVGPLGYGTDIALRLVWLPAGRLPAGDYQLWVWIPPEAANTTAVVTYDLLADGQLLEPPNGAGQEQRLLATGQWRDMGIWTLPQESAVSVAVTGVTNDSVAAYPLEGAANDGQPDWFIAADAVALLRVEK